jgi:hypothetical protein
VIIWEPPSGTEPEGSARASFAAVLVVALVLFGVTAGWNGHAWTLIACIAGATGVLIWALVAGGSGGGE